MAQPSLQTEAYSNWVMLNEQGQPMTRCAEKRARWYLNRGLAELVKENPPTIRLLFKPNGPGNQGDAYSMAEKRNRCVVCGTEEDLTKHHIVPFMYRRFLPDEVKNRSSHDIVVICVTCHGEYEEVATDLKKVIACEHGCTYSEGTNWSDEDRDYHHLTGLARSLVTHCDVIPHGRQNEMLAEIMSGIGRPISIAELEELGDRERLAPSGTSEPGKPVVDSVMAANQLLEFVKRWRQHFLDVAHPKFMPEHWDVNRPLVRD